MGRATKFHNVVTPMTKIMQSFHSNYFPFQASSVVQATFGPHISTVRHQRVVGGKRVREAG